MVYNIMDVFCFGCRVVFYFVLTFGGEIWRDFGVMAISKPRVEKKRETKYQKGTFMHIKLQTCENQTVC